MTSTILFLCPHHAAKSVIAEAYFNRLAEQSRLAFNATSAGTDPEEVVSPAVVNLLRDEGFDVSQQRPRRVTAAELANAHRIISMGCILSDLEVAPDRVEQWDDIPPVSQNILVARDAIQVHVERLVAQLQNEE